jgi:hypothetical protein
MIEGYRVWRRGGLRPRPSLTFLPSPRSRQDAPGTAADRRRRPEGRSHGTHFRFAQGSPRVVSPSTATPGIAGGGMCRTAESRHVCRDATVLRPGRSAIWVR